MARPLGSENKDKPFRDALRMQIAAAGEDRPRLRRIADALLDKAETGDVAAIKEVGDRLDGKPAQAIIGDDESDPVRIATITRLIIRPPDSNGGSVPPATPAGSV